MSFYVKRERDGRVDADSRTGAIGDLVERLEHAGFTVYEGDEPDAFESED